MWSWPQGLLLAVLSTRLVHPVPGIVPAPEPLPGDVQACIGPSVPGPGLPTALTTGGPVCGGTLVREGALVVVVVVEVVVLVGVDEA